MCRARSETIHWTWVPRPFRISTQRAIRHTSSWSQAWRALENAETLHENVRRKRYDFTVEKNIGRLFEFYQDIIKLRGCGASTLKIEGGNVDEG